MAATFTDSNKDYPNSPSNRAAEIWNGNIGVKLAIYQQYEVMEKMVVAVVHDVGLWQSGSPSNRGTYEFENHASSGSFAV